MPQQKKNNPYRLLLVVGAVATFLAVFSLGTPGMEGEGEMGCGGTLEGVEIEGQSASNAEQALVTDSTSNNNGFGPPPWNSGIYTCGDSPPEAPDIFMANACDNWFKPGAPAIPQTVQCLIRGPAPGFGPVTMTVKTDFQIKNGEFTCGESSLSVENVCGGSVNENRCNTDTGTDISDSCTGTLTKSWSSNWSVGGSVTSKLSAKVPFCVKSETAVEVNGSKGGDKGTAVAKEYVCRAGRHVPGCQKWESSYQCLKQSTPGHYTADIYAKLMFEFPGGGGWELDCEKIGSVTADTMIEVPVPAEVTSEPEECVGSERSGNCTEEKEEGEDAGLYSSGDEEPESEIEEE